MSTIFSTVGSAVTTLCTSALRLPTARKLAIAAASGVMLAGTSAAQANHDDRDYHHRDHVQVEIAVGRPDRCEPVYETREVKVWVAPVYRTVCDHVWREPVYRTVCEKVFVPEVCEVREVRHSDRYRTWCTRERVVVVPAHYEDRQCQQLVCAGHFEDVQRQELVCDGHYDCRTERVLIGERRETPAVEVVNPLLRGLTARVYR